MPCWRDTLSGEISIRYHERSLAASAYDVFSLVLRQSRLKKNAVDNLYPPPLSNLTLDWTIKIIISYVQFLLNCKIHLVVPQVLQK